LLYTDAGHKIGTEYTKVKQEKLNKIASNIFLNFFGQQHP